MCCTCDFDLQSLLIKRLSSFTIFMTPLRKAYCSRRLLHSSPHLCLRSSPIHKEKECDDLTCINNLIPKSDVAALTVKESESTLPESDESSFPEEPSTCCMSGCANCVWVEYADQLVKVLKDGEKAREVILSKVSDPNMRAFLLMELRNLENKNGDKPS